MSLAPPPPESPNTTSDPPTMAASRTSTLAHAAGKQPLTLIVATTPITSPSGASKRRLLGIGHNNSLPWPRIKSDMTFFARVTTRPPPLSSPAASIGSNQSDQHTSAINAVIMGRKTYDSLPDRFRPLPRRLNVIITRDASGEVQRRAIADWKAARRREKEREALKRAVMAGELQSQEAALAQADTESAAVADGQVDEQPEVLVSNSLETALRSLRSQFPLSPHKQLGNIFIIGGGEIYASALRLDSHFLRDYSVRILLTDVRRRGQRQQQPQHHHEEEAEEEPQASVQKSSGSPDNQDPSQEVDGFECTTFFPLDLDEIENESNWRKASPAEVTQWAGEEVSGEWKWEDDIAVRMCGYEKVEPTVRS